MGEINKIYTKEELICIILDQLKNMQKKLNSHTWKHDKVLNTNWRNAFYKNMLDYMEAFVKLMQAFSQEEVNNHFKDITTMVELNKTLNNKFEEKISIPNDPTELIDSQRILEKRIEAYLKEQMRTVLEIFTKFKKFQTDSN